MHPISDSHIVVMPWYDEDEFQRLCELTPALAPQPPRFEDWRRKAQRCLIAMLATGRTVAIVTIKLDRYRAWLGPQADSLELRRRYVASLVWGEHEAD